MIPVAERALGTQALAGGLHMSSTAEASGAEGSLREQWVSHTFQATRQQTRLRGFPLTTMQRFLDEVIRDRSARLILIRDPLPADDASEAATRRTPAATSNGLTRTALLQVFKDRLKARRDCVVVAFDARDMGEHGSDFFKT